MAGADEQKAYCLVNQFTPQHTATISLETQLSLLKEKIREMTAWLCTPEAGAINCPACISHLLLREALVFGEVLRVLGFVKLLSF